MRKKTGFTLIELLVVVAIIAVLIAILLPSLGKARSQAKRSKCLANVRSIAVCFKTYYADWSSLLPYATTSGNWPNSYWTKLLESYGNLEKMRQCPSASNPVDTTGAQVAGTTSNSWYQTPNTSVTPNVVFGTGGYCTNGWLFSATAFDSAAKLVAPSTSAVTPAPPASMFFRWPLAVADASVPSVADGVWTSAWPQEADTGPTTPAELESLAGYGETISTKNNQIHRFTLNRHDKAICVAFADGHGEAVKLSDLWIQKWHAQWTRNQTVPIP
jgi:prepilin-type N-terminal cleavage/methylation domain-containing protein